MLRAYGSSANSAGGKVRRSGRGGGNGRGAGGGDPYFSNVISLLHFDGSDLSTTITDETGRVWTRTGTGALAGLPVISTTQSVFGGASMRNGGQPSSSPYTDYSWLYTAASTDWDLGTSDWTLEGRTYPLTVVGNGRCYFGLQPIDTTGYCPIFIYQNGTTLQLYMSSNGTTWNLASAAALGTCPVNTWVAWAVVRSGANIYAFNDGVLQSTTNIGAATSLPYHATRNITIGYGGQTVSGGASYDGYVDEFRFTKGVARYTANYTLATAAFPNN